MKSKIVSLTLVVIAFTLGASALSALADWTSPTCTPPNCNAPTPLNVATTSQSKVGPLQVNWNAISPATIGLQLLGKIQIINSDVGVGKVLTSDANGVGTWQDGGGMMVVGDGKIDGGSNGASAKNLGSDWDIVFFEGNSQNSDGSAAGGYVYKLSGQFKAALSAGGYKNIFTLTQTLQCSTGNTSFGDYSLCAKIDSSGNLIIETGNLAVVYIKTAGGGGGGNTTIVVQDTEGSLPIFTNGIIGVGQSANIGSDWDQVRISGNNTGHVYKSGNQVIAALASGNQFVRGTLIPNQAYCATQSIGGSPRICVTLESNGDLTIFTSYGVIYTTESF